MIRNFTLFLVLSLCSTLLCKFANAITYVNNGTATNYSLTSGDSLFIATGIYTGNISSFPAGAKITVSTDATFQPGSFPNNAAGTMYVHGTAIIAGSPVRTNTGFTLYNYGICSINGATVMNGSGQVWTNNFGAVLNFNGDVTVNTNTESNSIINYGTINCSAMLTMTSGAQLTNYKKVNVAGEFRVNGGTLENRGKLETTGLLNFNNGAAIIRNYCGMSSLGGIRNTSSNFYNYSYLWARNDLGLGDITNSGTIYNVNWSYENPTQAMIHGRSLDNSGSISGKGWLYFYGTTSQTGGGITGAAGVTTDTLKMYDLSRSNFGLFYDPTQGGTVHANSIYNAWGVPDSTRAYFVGCSVEIIMEVPLAINWNSFVVDLFDNVPVLNWSAEFDRPTVFEIQRSYDGRSFSAIGQVSSIEGRTDYSYNDKSVNNQSGVVYYRIKAAELGGEVKYSQTRLIRFTNKPGSIYMAPNPFTNNFIINYRAALKETITIRMLNVSGQQMLTKNVTVIAGNNAININDVAHLARGIYVIQVSKDTHMISSGKIIKQ